MDFYKQVALFKKVKIYMFLKAFSEKGFFLFCDSENQSKALKRLIKAGLYIGCIESHEILSFLKINDFEKFSIDHFLKDLSCKLMDPDPKFDFYKEIIIPAYEQLSIQTFKETDGYQLKKIYSFNSGHPFSNSGELSVSVENLLLALKTHQKESLNIIFEEFMGDQWSPETVLDLGGGFGACSDAILRVCPKLKIVLYDLKSIQEKFNELNSFQDNITFVSGDFLNSKEIGLSGLSKKKFDLIIISLILHDWCDKKAEEIISRTLPHLEKGGRIAVLEKVYPTEGHSEVVISDIDMLLQTEGRERTLSEFEELFAKFNLKLNKCIGDESERALLEFVEKE